MIKQCSLTISIITMLITFSLSAFAATEVTQEDKVKAAITYNLTKFVTWPENEQTLSFCVVGSGAINSELQKINHQYSDGRRISVSYKKAGARLTRLCDVVYIHSTDLEKVNAILAKLIKQPVLTISDSPNFIRRGGGIELFRAGSRIRFAISKQVTQEAGLSVDAQLIKLATGAPK